MNYCVILAATVGVIHCEVRSAHAQSAEWKWYEVKDKKVQIHLHVFWSVTCPHCTKAHQFLAGLKQRHDWIIVKDYEVSGNPANLQLYRDTAAGIGRVAGQVPAFFYCKQLEIGFVSDESSGAKLERALIWYRDQLQKQVDRQPGGKPAANFFLAQPKAEPEFDLDFPQPVPEETVDVPGWGAVKAGEVSLPLLTVVMGGLDAFNPCAFFVLLILMSLMLHAGSRWRMMLVGGVYVAISGLVYFLFMAAWLNLFFLVGHLRIITLAAGVVAVAAAAVNIKDYFWFKKGVSLSLSDSARSKLVGRMTDLLRRNSLVSVVAGTAALAFASNLYELLCTSGLPLIYTRVLTLRNLGPSEYYGYLVLYNVVYVLPLLAIAGFFTLTLSSRKLTERQGRILKLLSGVMMFSLGIILVAAPELLTGLVGASVALGGAVATTAFVVLIERVFTYFCQGFTNQEQPRAGAAETRGNSK